MQQRVLLFVALVVLVLGTYYFLRNSSRQSDTAPGGISSYEECVAAGYVTPGTAAGLCKTPDGREFRQGETQGAAVAARTIVGTLGCLPRRESGGPLTLECAIGLLDEAGNYYALRDRDPSFASVATYPTGSSVEVYGTFRPQVDTTYQSVGLIVVERVTELEG